MPYKSLSDYIKDHYGLCDKEKCHCIKFVWLGRKCENWKSSDCNTYEELKEWQKSLKNE